VNFSTLVFEWILRCFIGLDYIDGLLILFGEIGIIGMIVMGIIGFGTGSSHIIVSGSVHVDLLGDVDGLPVGFEELD
jgi:hypothetical protein